MEAPRNLYLALCLTVITSEMLFAAVLNLQFLFDRCFIYVRKLQTLWRLKTLTLVQENTNTW